MSAKSIDQILEKRKILITCGTGGVGKTTLSAAIAIRAALLGKRTVVITIDPAKRLATSLGIKELGDHPTDLTPRIREALDRAVAHGAVLPAGVDRDFKGTLDAIVPDTRKTFEDFINDLAPNPAVAERVMRNPIFQIFAKEFSGTNEYMSLERLYALNRLNQYDCIILDTPPSRNTLAFLDAPKLLVAFFEERLIRWLVLPANKIVSAGMRKALGILEKLTGAGFMTSLFDFAAALFEVRARFTANLNAITHLLESQDVGFLMVTAPTPQTAPEVTHFIQSVREHGFHFDGVAVNRTLGYLSFEALGDASQSGLSPETEKAFSLLRSLQERERTALDPLFSTGRFGEMEIPLCGKLPELARDVHSVEDLFHVAMAFNSAAH